MSSELIARCRKKILGGCQKTICLYRSENMDLTDINSKILPEIRSSIGLNRNTQRLLRLEERTQEG